MPGKMFPRDSRQSYAINLFLDLNSDKLHVKKWDLSAARISDLHEFMHGLIK